MPCHGRTTSLHGADRVADVDIRGVSPRRLRSGVWISERSPVALDLAIAVFLFAYTTMEIVSRSEENTALHLVAAAAMILPLALRRTVPLAPALGFSVAMIESIVVVPINSFGEFIAAMLAVYSLAAHARPREALVGGVLIGAAIIVFLFRDPTTDSVASALETIVILLVWAVIGTFVRRRRVETQDQTRRAAVDERTRIARELHDLVGHAVSLMTVQTGVARVALDGNDTARAYEALAAVEGAGHEALDELRRILGILRGPEDTSDDLAPQPGIEALEGVVDQVRSAGLPVDLAVEGKARPLPAGVALASYRIVQEALTNVRKHAGPVGARVTVRYEPDQVRIDIRDDGSGPRGRARPGHGLNGMRERAELYGGRLEAQADPDGGFVVTAEIPTTESSR